jgi:hypothetical protein
VDVSITIDKKSKLEVTLTVDKHDDEPNIHVQFLPRDTDHYVWEGVLQLIQKRMNDDGMNTICENANDEADFFKISARPASPIVWCDSYRLCGIAYYALKEVQQLTKDGLELPSALDKVYDQPMQDIELGEAGEELMDRITPAYDAHVKKLAATFTRSAVGCLKLVMPLQEATKVAEKLGAVLTEKYNGQRPLIKGDSVINRGTKEDELYAIVTEACAAVPEEKGRRRYAVGALFDTLHALYTSAPIMGRQVS